MTAELDPRNAYGLLCQTVHESIRRTLRDGAAKPYAPGEWLEHSIDEHIQHGEAHASDAELWVAPASVARARTAFTLWADPVEALKLALDHAICRLAMARAILERGK